MKNPAVTQYPIHELLKNRWSPRAFAAREIEPEKLLSLFEAARWAPSGGNAQPWAFVICRADVNDPLSSDARNRFLELLTGRNPLWAWTAPVLVLTVMNRERRPGVANYTAMYDLGQAVAHLTVQAEAAGLSVHQMGGFDRERARELFELPETWDPITVLAIGYQGRVDALPEELREGEGKPRSRKPLSEFVFEGKWSVPVQEIEKLAE